MNLVFISDRLPARHSALVDGLGRILADHVIPLRTIAGTRDIWCRDYMPVQLAPGEFLQYRYEPDYLRDGFEHLMTRPGDIAPIPEVETCLTSDMILDGGNVVRWGSRCIMTEKVFRENPRLARGDLLVTLRRALRVEDLIVIPKEPYDVVGHADGVVRFLDDGLIVINDYSDVAPWYGRRLRSILRRAGLERVELPYRPEEAYRGGIPSAVGCYANFLRVRDLVIVPAYGRREDDRACRVIAENTDGVAVVPLDCRGLAAEGGVLNCVAWAIARGRESIESNFTKENERE
jgi:agmatine deiminase